MNIIYYITGFTIVLGLPALLALLILLLVKPDLVNKHSKINSRVSRVKIAIFGTIGLFVAIVLLGCILAATEPANVRAERLAQDAQIKEKNEMNAKKAAVENNEGKQTNNTFIKSETKTEVIPYQSTTRSDTTLPVGQQKISVTGRNGERTITYQVTYVNGKETARTQTNNEVTVQPVTQITLNGTYQQPVANPAPTPNVNGAVIKMSSAGICHAPGSTYYDQTINFTPYVNIDACLAAGGRLPKK